MRGLVKLAVPTWIVLAPAKTLFRILDIIYAGELLFSGIDEKGAITKHPDALRHAFLAGQKLVEESKTE